MTSPTPRAWSILAVNPVFVVYEGDGIDATRLVPVGQSFFAYVRRRLLCSFSGAAIINRSVPYLLPL